MFRLTFASLFLFTASASAISIPVIRDISRRSTSISFKTPASAHDYDGTTQTLENQGDIMYTGEIVLDGQTFTVRLHPA